MALRSIQHGDAKVSVHYRQGEMEVMVVEIGARASLVESTLWGGASWHLVVEGQAIFQQGDKGWELLPEDSLQLESNVPYTIVNPCPERLKLVSIVATGARAEKEELV